MQRCLKAKNEEYEELMEGNLFEKKFSTAQRDKLATKGYAMPDGSFPIATGPDLKNAIKAHGRAKEIWKRRFNWR